MNGGAWGSRARQTCQISLLLATTTGDDRHSSRTSRCSLGNDPVCCVSPLLQPKYIFYHSYTTRPHTQCLEPPAHPLRTLSSRKSSTFRPTRAKSPCNRLAPHTRLGIPGPIDLARCWTSQLFLDLRTDTRPIVLPSCRSLVGVLVNFAGRAIADTDV